MSTLREFLTCSLVDGFWIVTNDLTGLSLPRTGPPKPVAAEEPAEGYMPEQGDVCEEANDSFGYDDEGSGEAPGDTWRVNDCACAFCDDGGVTKYCKGSCMRAFRIKRKHGAHDTHQASVHTGVCCGRQGLSMQRASLASTRKVAGWRDEAHFRTLAACTFRRPPHLVPGGLPSGAGMCFLPPQAGYHVPGAGFVLPPHGPLRPSMTV
ncbi:hypothetical protein WJX81_003242 [Elliptochloris bilobata]|uniref:C2H2-type domain-containing protein n=1 Tax=Elliptochloris bilobata TaxID=381761 RepID=A0AAW1RB04_9CHLO